MPRESEEYDRTIAKKYRQCRLVGHAWDFTTVVEEKGEYLQGMACMRCPVRKTVRISIRDGDRLPGKGYDYSEAPGYLMQGGGRLTPEERGELWLVEVPTHLRRRRRRAG